VKLPFAIGSVFEAVKSTVAQRTSIKQQKARIETLQKEEEAERDRARMRARERVIRDFERAQTGLGRSTSEQEDDKKLKSGEGGENGEYIHTHNTRAFVFTTI
jgi:hypothetical protein